MSFNRFAAAFVAVTLLSYGKSQITDYWVPIEFSFFLIFFVIRSCSERLALVYTFFVSLGLDMILQVGLIKGIPCVAQLLLVYLIMKLKRHVVPNFQDSFLLLFFGIFYIANYFLCRAFSFSLGREVFPYPEVSIWQLLFLAFFHTCGFLVLIFVDDHLAKRGNKT